MNRVRKFVSICRVRAFRSALLRHGVAAAVEHHTALRSLPLRTVVDVGANRGQFCLFALHAFPQASVVSLEPLRSPSDKFLQVFAGEPRVTLHRAALGPVAGETIMHVSGRDDSSSLLPISGIQSQLFAGTEEVGTEKVTTARLSDLIRRDSVREPAMLKLDVQGYELEALRACDDMLDCFSYVCAEVSFTELYIGQSLADELIAWLRERGFELERMYGTRSDADGNAIQADILFKRPDKQ